MVVAERDFDDERRLRSIEAYEILDTDPEPEFDELAQLAARICEMPIAAISFVTDERNWLKAEVGLDVREVPVEISICSHAILQHGLLEIEDLSRDARTAQNPLVAGPPGLRFYAGAALVAEEGLPLGTLCVLDTSPRRLTEVQRLALTTLGRQVTTQLRLRRALRAEAAAHQTAREEAARRSEALELARTLRLEIDHRVKNSLQLVSSLLSMQAGRSQRAEVRQALEAAKGRVRAISSIHAALNQSDDATTVPLGAYAARLVDDLQATAPSGVRIALRADEITLGTAQASSLAILLNEFVTNSLKYAFPHGRGGLVTLEIRLSGAEVAASFADDGVGHSSAKQGPLREGLGLRIMRAVGQQLGAELTFEADVTGTSLAFRFPLDAPR
jgi:two-component sensor histidine kinase